MSVYVPDVMEKLLACLCGELKRRKTPVCDCQLVYGERIPPMDLCACECDSKAQGAAWARLVSLDANPTSSDVTRSTVGPCGASWSATVQLGVYRCVTVSEDGSPPDPRDRTKDAELLASDALALARAVSCCLDPNDISNPVVLAITPYRPVGPSGGGAGGTISITFGLD